MAKRLSFIFLFAFSGYLTGQPAHIADSFQNAQKNGNAIWALENEYPKACSSDTSVSVFKTEREVNKMYSAYNKMLDDFRNYLKVNGYRFDNPVKCINRVYFSSNGSIDYFYFNFLASNPADKPSLEKQDQFKRLLAAFIADYRVDIVAPSKFAHYAPTTFTNN